MQSRGSDSIDLGNSTSFTYDAENNLLTSTDRLGRTTGYQYDALDRQTRITYPDNSFAEMEYDAVGRVMAEIDERGNRTEHEYDAAGRRIATEDALGNRHTFTYDVDGNLISETDARGNLTTYSYNSLDQRTQTTWANGSFSQEVFDALGRRTQMTDQAGRTTHYEYDALGRLTKVTDALNQETTFTYDEQGNKLTQTDAEGRTTSWTYDALGRVLTRTLPLGQSESMTYDGNGNMTSHTDFNGNTHTRTYDINDRLTQVDYADGTTEAFTYDAVGNRLSASITDTSGTRTWGFTYDVRDRLTQATTPEGHSLDYGYDAAGNKTSLTVSYLGGNSYSESYAYDVLNRLETVTDKNNNVTTYTYDAVGNRASTTNGNATLTSYGYDSLNRLTNLSHTTGLGADLLSFSYELDPTGRRTKITEGSGRITDYVYDDLYRLISETITDATNGNYSASYQYDMVGNRTQETVQGITTGYTYDANDRITQSGGRTYTYDNIGNTLTEAEGGSTVLYSYNSQNELIQRTEAGVAINYQYNPDGIRTHNGDTYHLVDLNRDYAQVLVEIDTNTNTNTEIVSYAYGDDLLSQSTPTQTHYYHYDGLGSTRALTDDTATLTDSYDYEAFGETLNQTGSTDNNYLYTGEQFDEAQDRYYLRARYYNPDIGRFTQMDTFQGFNQDPVTLHKYLYASVDPANMIDPTGNFSIASTMKAVSIVSNLITTAQTTIDVFQSLAQEGSEVSPTQIGLNIILSRLPVKAAAKYVKKLCKFIPKNSFVEGTLVSTSQGLVPIEDVKIGDLVMSLNVETSEMELKEVTHLIRNFEHYDLVRINFSSGIEVVSTDDHLIYVLGEGWITAGDLSGEDIVITEEGTLSVASTEKFSEEIDVFNISVADNHNYFVSEDRVLVHNDTIYHYTDLKGFNAIRSGGLTYTFKPSKPRRAGNPTGVYFTQLPPFDPKLARRLGVTNKKIQYVFQMESALVPNLRTLTPVTKLYSKEKVTVPSSDVIAGPNLFQQSCNKKK